MNMRGSSLLAVFLLILTALCGCQGVARPTVAPTLTPILLVSPTEPAEPTAYPTETPIPVALVPEATVMPTPSVTAPPTQAIRRVMALGVRQTLVLRAEPRANTAAVAQVPGSEVLWAEGRSADGKWLWVAFGDAGAHGWLFAADAKAFGDMTGLPTVKLVAEVVPTATSAPGIAAAPARGSLSAPRLTGKIAFQTAIGGDIYLVNADGSGLRKLTTGLDPSLSPDGKRLVFARWGSPHGVFVLDLDTGEERRLATANLPRDPAWSPDGSQVAFLHVLRTKECRATPFGCLTDAELRARLGGKDCIDTPMGRYCITDFRLEQINQIGIAQVGSDGQGWLDVSSASDAQSLEWRPRQDELLYRGDGGLQIAVPGGAPRPLVEEASYSSPAWSPDGQRIAVQVHLADHSDLFLLDAAGQVIQRLTAPPDALSRAPDNVAAAWSPDGRFILFLSNRDGAWRLYRMNADGSGQAPFLAAVLKGISFKYDFSAERVATWSP